MIEVDQTMKGMQGGICVYAGGEVRANERESTKRREKNMGSGEQRGDEREQRTVRPFGGELRWYS